MAQRLKGWRAPQSGVGFPHGKDKKQARRERAYARGAQKPKAKEPS
jgi:hypothetical protein